MTLFSIRNLPVAVFKVKDVGDKKGRLKTLKRFQTYRNHVSDDPLPFRFE